jgi:hypothetical protein
VHADWAARVISAVDSDNETPDCRCSTSATAGLLDDAPPAFRVHAELALADFIRAGNAPLGDLRSDTVATRFEVAFPPDHNLLVARMTVPGGPWPGHFGLEAIVFDAFRAGFPAWFPATVSAHSVDFADVIVASNGFMRGQGAVLFPELLALRGRLEHQSFGVVFLDKLTSLYSSRVVPALADLVAGPVAGADDPRTVRQIAFLAHEWGHLSGPIPYEQTVRARRRRLIAVISELYADLAGLAMLVEVGTTMAGEAANVVILDRIVREAWLPRAHSQVDSVTARQLLVLLRDTRYAEMTSNGVTLSLERAAERLAHEMHTVGQIDMACAHGDVEPARHYLLGYGWRLDDTGYHVELDDPFSQLLRTAVRKMRHSTRR